MKKPLIVANWKMGVDLDRSLNEVKEMVDRTTPEQRSHLVICPSAPAISLVRSSYTGALVGAQDCSILAQGALTGDVSARDLRALGCSHVIVGHSERRSAYGETDGIVAQKVSQAIAVGLRPIICIGERAAERSAGRAKSVIRRQILGALKLVQRTSTVKFVVAYEPVWAVGAKHPATIEQIREMHEEITRLLRQWSGARAVSFGILYGGSVDASTVRAILHLPVVDGILAGRASWKGTHLAKLLRSALTV